MNKNGVLPLVLALVSSSTPDVFGQSPAVREAVVNTVDGDYGHLFELYRYLHSNPELSLHEAQTAAHVAGELRQAGFDVSEGVGGHGVVAVLSNGVGPVVLVRTDLDALPVKEQTGLPYASTVTTKDDQGSEVPIMHACGHDVHMTSLIGTARALQRLRQHWHGTVVLIGQPAEERGVGARRMLADGLFKRFPKPEYCLALHVSPDVPAGSVGYTQGYALANVDSVDITIRGVGGHGAFPHRAKDPIVLAAETVLALQTVVSREVAPDEPAVVTVGSIHGGTKHNIIPDEVRLQLTLRSYTDEVRQQTIAAVKRITRGLAVAAGVPEDRMPTVQVSSEHTPATYNDPKLTERLVAVWQSWLGGTNVTHRKPVMGGEDFSEYGRTEDQIPICIFWLGAVAPATLEMKAESGQTPPSLHSPLFAPVPEPTIKTGVTATTAAVLELLGVN